MTDRKKVIRGLVEISDHMQQVAEKSEDPKLCGMFEYWHEMAEDAIVLLREQDAMHWISVKDGLPTYAELKDDCVLVLLDDGGICSTGFDECIENESIFGTWRQNFDPVTLGATDSYWMPLEGVTHWMPIPKLPWEGR